MRKPGGTFEQLYFEDTHWLNSNNEYLDIKKMDISYVLNTVVMLRRLQLDYKKDNQIINIPNLFLYRINKHKQTNPEYFL